MKTIGLRSLLCFAAVLLPTLVVWSAEEKIKPESLPKAVADAVKARFPEGKITDAAKEEDDGKVVYDVELKMNGRKYESDILANGTILEVEKEIDAKDLPAAVTKAIDAQYPKSTIKEVMEVNKVKGKEEKPDHYEVTLKTSDGKEVESLLTLDGKPYKD
jgi:uncharacterized membrane protein YkoI